MTDILESSSSNLLMNSLPYVETVHEDYEEYALALIEEEMKVIVPRPMRKMAPINFRTKVMRIEYDSLVVQGEAEGADDSQTTFVQTRPREQLQLFQPRKITKPSTIEEWKKNDKSTVDAISQIKSRYESERIRGMILEAEKEEAVANWKDYNAKLDELAGFWSAQLKQELENVEEINFLRQETQTQQVGPEIDRLNQEYQEALYRRNQLKHAIEGLKRKNRTPSDEKNRKRKIDFTNDI